MFYPGLVSISFRPLSPEQVIEACKNAGLSHVEWGTDSHVKTPEEGDKAYRAGVAAGVKPCSCGSYYKLGLSTPDDLKNVLETAHALHTDIVRIWGGNRGSAELTENDFSKLVGEAYRAAELAESYGITLCLECHPNTVTDRYESELRFLSAVSHPNLRTYWQPNQFESFRYNMEAAEALAKDTRMIHVFAWSATERFPLEAHLEAWSQYLSVFHKAGGTYGTLLEFMPDNRPESLPHEADTLRRLLSSFS